VTFICVVGFFPGMDFAMLITSC